MNPVVISFYGTPNGSLSLRLFEQLAQGCSSQKYHLSGQPASEPGKEYISTLRRLTFAQQIKRARTTKTKKEGTVLVKPTFYGGAHVLVIEVASQKPYCISQAKLGDTAVILLGTRARPLTARGLELLAANVVALAGSHL